MAMKANTAPRSKYTQLNLQGRRMKCGLSLETIADSTKISMRFLRAIEDEEFEKLPGGIFSTSYLRQYADATGYDEAALLALYFQEVAPEPAQVEVPPPAARGLLRWLRMPIVANR